MTAQKGQRCCKSNVSRLAEYDGHLREVTQIVQQTDKFIKHVLSHWEPVAPRTPISAILTEVAHLFRTGSALIARLGALLWRHVVMVRHYNLATMSSPKAIHELVELLRSHLRMANETHTHRARDVL